MHIHCMENKAAVFSDSCFDGVYSRRCRDSMFDAAAYRLRTAVYW